MASRGLPQVAIVGRPNVGKSTLFNRIVGRRQALVDDQPGVTRDRLVTRAEWAGARFSLVDTGGFEATGDTGLAGRVREQSLRAASGADAILFVVDGRAGLAPADAEAARVLARTGKPLLCVVNKIDGLKQESLVYDFFQLGLGDPVGVSAEHGLGLDDLLDRLVKCLPPGEHPEPKTPTRITIIGRPNVGKSSILNRLAGEDRVLVDASAGTTRDAVDIPIEHEGDTFVVVDTAGIRRRSRIDDSLERASVSRAFDSVERADVAILVIDAGEGMTDQDARLARRVWERGRGLLLAVNKWDLLPREVRKPLERLQELRARYHHLANVPAVFLSALEGTHVEDLLPAARRVHAAWKTRIPTRILNAVVEDAAHATEPPIVSGKRARFFYATSTGTGPPAVTFFVNDPRRVPTSYLRYLENRIREAVALEGTPLRLILRARPRAERGWPRPDRKHVGRRRA